MTKAAPQSPPSLPRSARRSKSSRATRLLPPDKLTDALRDYLKLEIRELVGDTVKATWKRCLTPGDAFVDGQSALRKSFVSTCEVLETLLIPMLVFGDDFLPKNRAREKINKLVVDSISYLIQQSKEFQDGQSPLCPGDPYVNNTGDKQTDDNAGWPYIEANAFFVSTILHFLLNEKYFKSAKRDFEKAELVEIAGKAIDQIMEQFTGDGWSPSTREFSSQIYFTWSLAETLIEVLECRDERKLDLIGPKRVDKLKGQLAQVRHRMERYLFGDRQFTFTPELINSKQTQPIYNALQAFITAGVLGTTYTAQMAQTLVSLVANSHLIADKPNLVTNYPIDHETGGARLEDRSILPLIVRAIATVFGEYYSKSFRDITEKARLRNPWSYIVMSDRIIELKKKQNSLKLWGPYGSTYEIYYTERVIEALISCYYYVAFPEKRPHDLALPKVDPETFTSSFSKIGRDLSQSE